MYNKSPFADWVPKPIMLLLIIIILFPLTAVSGVYMGNATDIAGALATYNEYISLANNASAIGMGLGILIAMRIKMRFRSKEIISVSCILLALLSYMCGTANNPWVLVIGSLLINFIKIFPIIEMILPVMFILSPSGDKGRFYAIFYPIMIAFGQVSSYFFANLVYNSSWQSPYLIMSAMMLVVAAVSLIFQHNQRFCFKKPLYYIDWLTMLLLTIAMMSLNIALTFMRQQGWMISPYIRWALFLFVVFLGLTAYRQRFLKRKMIDFSIFTRTNVWHSMLLLLFLGIYLASSSVFSQYVVGVLGYNNLINAQLNLWMIPGMILAGVYAFFSFKNRWNLKYYIATGFIAFFLHTLCLYLLLQLQMDVTYLQAIMTLKGLGMGILFIGIWYYASVGLEMNQLFGLMCILLMLRSFISTALGGAILSWATYNAQWQSLNDIGSMLDVGNFANGMLLYRSLNLNALMASGKIVLGALCWFTLPILVFVLTHHYGQFNYRRVILFRKAIRGNSIKGYRLT